MAKAKKKVVAEGEEEVIVAENLQTSLLGKFVFMDKTLQVLDVGIKTGKNVILYGPGE